VSGPPYSGGCQCGAVRFRADAEPKRASICHCRMCQKAMAAPFGAFATFPLAAVVWTRAARKTFLSSEHVARGFCGDCGTPLTFEAAAGGDSISLSICAFDDPQALKPQRQLAVEARLGWLADIGDLPGRSPADEAAVKAKYPPVVSRQHPDHDTDTWPPAG
jgi:hypothetical protein